MTGSDFEFDGGNFLYYDFNEIEVDLTLILQNG